MIFKLDKSKICQCTACWATMPGFQVLRSSRHGRHLVRPLCRRAVHQQSGQCIYMITTGNMQNLNRDSALFYILILEFAYYFAYCSIYMQNNMYNMHNNMQNNSALFRFCIFCIFCILQYAKSLASWEACNLACNGCNYISYMLDVMGP
jgi:hypothetical protein